MTVNNKKSCGKLLGLRKTQRKTVISGLRLKYTFTLLFHFSERAGKAAGTRKSSRQSWLSIVSMCHSISRITACFCLCGSQEHATQCAGTRLRIVGCLIFLLVCLFGVETSRFTQSKCCVFCVPCSVLGFMVFCVCVCSAFSLVQSPLDVLSCLVCDCIWALKWARTDADNRKLQIRLSMQRNCWPLYWKIQWPYLLDQAL